MPEAISMDRHRFRALAQEHSGHTGTGRADISHPAARPYTVLSRQIPADLDTPVSALLKLRQGSYCFLLESVERGSQVGRYSFLGTGPGRVLVGKDTHEAAIGDGGGQEGKEGTPTVTHVITREAMGELQRLLAERYIVLPDEAGLPRFVGGAVGYTGYEVACTLEPVRPAPHDPLDLPDLVFAFYDTVLVFDHVQRTAQVLTLAPLTARPDLEYDRAIARIERVMDRLRRPLSMPTPTPAPTANGRDSAALNGTGGATSGHEQAYSNLTRTEFERMVETAKEHISAGDIIQVVLSQRFERPTSADPFTIYRALRMVNPSPYMFFLQFGDLYLVGASPEMLVRVEGGRVTTRPIAGTRPRGRTRHEDHALEQQLLADEKERAEHLMLVDLARNDIGRIARVGTVRVPRFMQVEHYSHVMHIVSEVEGELAHGLGPVDAFKACFPAGTVSGAPRVRAMQIISELERDRRGPYAGAVGYIGYDGNMDTAITIRTAVIKQEVAFVQAGAGIVADSVPSTEYMETVHKAHAMLAAIAEAERIEMDMGMGTEMGVEMDEGGHRDRDRDGDGDGMRTRIERKEEVAR